MKVKTVKAFFDYWLRRNRILSFALASGISLILLLATILLNLSFSWIFLFVAYFVGVFLINRNARPSLNQVYSHLHMEHPEFEYSLRQLEYKEHSHLLEILQREKIQEKLENSDLKIPRQIGLILQNLALGTSVLAFLFLAFLLKTEDSQSSAPKLRTKEREQVLQSEKVDSAYIDELKVKVLPPRYTGIPSRISRNLDLNVVEGTELSWTYRENGPIESVDFLIGEDEALKVGNGSPKHKAIRSFLYYHSCRDIKGEKVNSPYFSVKVKEDELPQASIIGLDEFQKLPWKENYDISFKIDLSDDYGLEDAFISATVATGSGESVLFREKKFELNNFKKNRKKHSSEFQFSTREFDMEPGSELYFYVMVKDNCPFRIQAAKTTTYFVVLEDTVKYEFADDAGMQVDLMPDFFRSQRQIIIDTEKLIEEEARVSREDFKKRSNELGFDQKMLRLKYGQFLGEEAESGIALENEIEAENHDHEHDHEEEGEHNHGENGMEDILNEYGHNHDHEAEEGELLATNGTEKEDPSRPSWVEELSHSHDNAEENTYFEISLKTKLKAALSVMWDAELHLRLYEPEASLPYQYQALEFLEEIKNHARIYVHRIGFDPPAIKVAEKRLSGEQDKVISPEFEMKRKEDLGRQKTEKAISYFSDLRGGEKMELSAEERSILEAAGLELAKVAIEQPSLLTALTLLREILNEEKAVETSNVLRVRRAMLLSLPERMEEIQTETQVFHPLNSAAIKALSVSR